MDLNITLADDNFQGRFHHHHQKVGSYKLKLAVSFSFCFALPSTVQWPQADVVGCHSIYLPQFFSKTAFASVQLFSQKLSPSPVNRFTTLTNVLCIVPKASAVEGTELTCSHSLEHLHNLNTITMKNKSITVPSSSFNHSLGQSCTLPLVVQSHLAARQRNYGPITNMLIYGTVVCHDYHGEYTTSLF